MLQKCDGRMYTCLQNDRKCIYNVDNLDGGSAMICDAIFNDRKTQMVQILNHLNNTRYRDDTRIAIYEYMVLLIL